MNGIEAVISKIKTETAAECEEIAKKAAEECARITAEYSKKEQDEYWKYLGEGAKETEKRLEQLSDLADQESKKQIIATREEMAEAAFALATEKLENMPENEYAALAAKHGMAPGAAPAELVAKYKEKLSRVVASALFD